MEFVSVNDRLPPPCTEVLAIRRVNRYGRLVARAVVTYISTHPRECVEDENITHWCHIVYPKEG